MNEIINFFACVKWNLNLELMKMVDSQWNSTDLKLKNILLEK